MNRWNTGNYFRKQMGGGRLGSPGKEAGGEALAAISIRTGSWVFSHPPPTFNPSALQLCSSWRNARPAEEKGSAGQRGKTSFPIRLCPSSSLTPSIHKRGEENWMAKIQGGVEKQGWKWPKSLGENERYWDGCESLLAPRKSLIKAKWSSSGIKT